MGEVVFAAPEELAWLESTLHPLVGQRVLEWRRGLSDDPGVAVVEVPLLFEGDAGGDVRHAVTVVAADDEALDAARPRVAATSRPGTVAS